MKGKMTLADARNVYELLEKVAKELQNTRTAVQMLMGMGRAIGYGAHLGISQYTQNLTTDEAEKKLFYNTVKDTRTAFLNYYQHSDRGKIIDKAHENRLIELIMYMKYATENQALPPLADAVDVAEKKAADHPQATNL